MKATILFCFVALALLLPTPDAQLYAQDEGHVYLVTTYKTAMPEGGSMRERDSLLALAFDWSVKKNDKILSERELVHWFTNDSQEWIVITELKDWADIEAAGKMDEELMKKAIPDDKKRREFNQRLAKYFPTHSDKIMREMPKLRK